MNHTTRKSTLLRGAGGLAAVLGATTIALAGLASSAAAAGNPDFDGILSAAPPTGFMSSPEAYDVSGGPVTVNFDTVVTNLTDTSQTVPLNFSADQILTYNGTDVSDGQPGQPGITFTGPQGTVQMEIAGSQSFSSTWSAGQVSDLDLQYTFDSCGYYQLDIWAKSTDGQRDRETLASGFIRVLGCDGDGGGSPTPSPTATPTPSQSPAGGVLGVSTPSTGAAGGGGSGLGLGALLLGFGMVLLVASLRRRAGVGSRLPRADV
jgi:hypothetical protein